MDRPLLRFPRALQPCSGLIPLALLLLALPPLYAQKKVAIKWPAKEATVEDFHPFGVEVKFERWYSFKQSVATRSLTDYIKSRLDYEKSILWGTLPTLKQMGPVAKQSLLKSIQSREEIQKRLKKKDEELLPDALGYFHMEEPTTMESCPATPDSYRAVSLYLYSWKTVVAAYRFLLQQELKLYAIKDKIDAGLIKLGKPPAPSKKASPAAKPGGKAAPASAGPKGAPGKTPPKKRK